MDLLEAKVIEKLINELGKHIRETIVLHRRTATNEELSQVAEVTKADTIYSIDKHCEKALLYWFEKNWPSHLPIELIMEGCEEMGTIHYPKNTPINNLKYKCIIDPIDGTRNLMYDKRSAWILIGVAINKGEKTSLRDISVSSMTELPICKQRAWDQLSAIKGEGIRASRNEGSIQNPIKLAPTKAKNCLHKFATVVRFFPEGLTLLAEIEETLWKSLYPQYTEGSPLVFNDQYITTGGQLYELIGGKDCFIADIRPLAFRKLGLQSSLACHPYDLASLLIAEEAGIIVEDPEGNPINAPLDTTTPVSWIAYANSEIRNHIKPSFMKIIKEKL